MSEGRKPPIEVKNIEPEGFKVLILPDPVEETTEGGIILPDTVKENEKFQVVTGEVVWIGPSANLVFGSGGLEIGDRVFYSKFSGVFVADEVTKAEYRLVNDEDIMARIK